MAKTPTEANELRSAIEGLNEAMEANYKARMKSLEAAKAESAAMGEKMSRADAMRAQSEANIELAKQRLDALQQSQSSLDAEIDSLEKRIQTGNDLDGTLQNELDLKEQLRNMAKSQIEEEIKEALAIKRSNEQRKKRIELSEKLAVKIGDTVGVNDKWKQSTLGMTYELYKNGGLIEGTKQLTAALKDQFSLENIAMSFLQNLIDTTIDLFKATDTATASFRKATGAGFEYDNMIAEAELDLRSYGVTVEEAGAQAQSLFTNYSKFTELSKAERKSLIQTNALLAKHGISAEAAAEQTAFLGEALGMNSEQIEQTSMDLVALGKDLGIPPSVISTEFKQASGELSKYGKNMVGVFRQLAAQSKATGLSVSELINVTSGFDTFDGASKKVSDLNQMLRGPYFNTIEMMKMDEAERANLIRETINQQGIDMDNMNKQQALFVAQAMGFNDVGKAMQFLRAESDVLDEMSYKAEQASYTQKQLADGTRDLMSLQEKLSALVKGFALNLSPLMEPISKVFNVLLDVQKEISGSQKKLSPFINTLKKGIEEFHKFAEGIGDMLKKFSAGGGFSKAGADAENLANSIGAVNKQQMNFMGMTFDAKGVFDYIRKAVEQIKSAFATGGTGQELFKQLALIGAELFGTGADGEPPIKAFIGGLAKAVKWIRYMITAAKVLSTIFSAIAGIVEFIANFVGRGGLVGAAGRWAWDKVMGDKAAVKSAPEEGQEEGFATGGVVTGPTRALIGEAGPEAVIPLNSGGSEVIASAAARMGASMAGGSAAAAAGGGGGVMTEAIKQAIVEGFKESANGSGQPTRNIELKLDRFVLGRVLDEHFAGKVKLD